MVYERDVGGPRVKIPVEKFQLKNNKLYTTLAEAVANAKAGDSITPVIVAEEVPEPEDIKSKLKESK